jgi:hypothetical protein
MRLKKQQRLALIQWVAEGLQSDEINLRASELDDPFSVGRTTVAHYRKTRQADIKRILEQSEDEALTTGLAVRSERIRKLKALAMRLERDLFSGPDDYVWTDQIKSIGSGLDAQVVEFEEFNAAEIVQYRGLLDDIAKEMGERKQNQDVNLRHSGKIAGLDELVLRVYGSGEAGRSDNSGS